MRRPQYYISPEEGILYNRDILLGIMPAIEAAYGGEPIDVEFDRTERSIRAPHSKLWVFDEQAAFNDALEETLNPPRWVEKQANRGRRVPLPHHLMIDIKGTFI